MAYYPIRPLFPLGQITLSAGAESLGVDLIRFIRRHMSGDWGVVSTYDVDMNQDAIDNQGAILSQYQVKDAKGASLSLSIMTEGDRSVTIIWLDSESPGNN